MPNKINRPLYVIAKEIAKDWGDKVCNSAEPYLTTMACLDNIDDKYGLDSGQDIVIRFLSNASTWRGDTARRVKAELKAMAKIK